MWNPNYTQEYRGLGFMDRLDNFPFTKLGSLGQPEEETNAALGNWLHSTCPKSFGGIKNKLERLRMRYKVTPGKGSGHSFDRREQVKLSKDDSVAGCLRVVATVNSQGSTSAKEAERVSVRLSHLETGHSGLLPVPPLKDGTMAVVAATSLARSNVPLASGVQGGARIELTADATAAAWAGATAAAWAGVASAPPAATAADLTRISPTYQSHLLQSHAAVIANQNEEMLNRQTSDPPHHPPHPISPPPHPTPHPSHPISPHLTPPQWRWTCGGCSNR